jgi:hypothetical protein
MEVNIMANCSEMKKGDVFVCDSCGLELKVTKGCTCDIDDEDACSAPLQCCGEDMVEK